MVAMDEATARRIMNDQDGKVREALRQFIAEQSRQALAVSANLTPWAEPWVEKNSPLPPEGDAATSYRAILDVRKARFKRRPVLPDDPTRTAEPVDLNLRLHLEVAFRWLYTAPAAVERWRNLKSFQGWISLGVNSRDDCLYSIGQAIQPEARYSRAYLGSKVSSICDNLNTIAAKLQEFQVSGQLVDVPDVIRAPRYGQLREGVLARLFAEDLEAQIAIGREIETSLADGTSASQSVQEWGDTAGEILAGLTSAVQEGFVQLISGAAACDCPGVADPDILARAYLALGLAYMEEVQERMSDYAEASGQMPPEPKVSMTFSGGTFYGGQFAAQIENIDTTIAGVLHQGGSDLADALEAIKQAVLSQQGLGVGQSRDLLDNVEYLAEAAQAPPGKRNRGIIKSVLGALATAATGGAELGKAMDVWGDVLHRLLP
jgi:hypothetical protein